MSSTIAEDDELFNGTVALDNDYLIYDSTSGALFYDEDGVTQKKEKIVR